MLDLLVKLQHWLRYRSLCYSYALTAPHPRVAYNDCWQLCWNLLNVHGLPCVGSRITFYFKNWDNHPHCGLLWSSLDYVKLTFISHDFVSDIRILSEKAGLLWSWHSQWNMAVLWIFWCYYTILMWGTCFQINLSQGGNRTGKYHSFSLYGQGNHRGENVGIL